MQWKKQEIGLRIIVSDLIYINQMSVIDTSYLFYEVRCQSHTF